MGKITTMNKNLILIVTALALGFSGAGCKKSNKSNQNADLTPPAGPVELKLKWPASEAIVQDMEMKMNMVLAIPGQPQPVQQNMTMKMGYSLKVLNAYTDGGHELEMEFLNAQLGMTMGGKSMLDYDSTKKAASDQDNPVADMFSQIIGSKIQYYLNASNDVTRVEGVEDLMHRLSSGGPNDPLASLKGSMFSKERFKEQIMNANRYLPSKPVQPGDSWPIKQSMDLGMLGNLTTDFECTFKNWEKHADRTCARVEFSGNFSSTPSTNAGPSGISMSILDGNSTGVFWFDPDLGMTVDTSINQDIKMAMNMPVNISRRQGAPAYSQTITNQMTQAMTVKLVSVQK